MPPSPLAERFSLAGRGALITGSSRGIGRAIADLFADAGAIVGINARHAEACEEAAAEINAAGGKAVAVAGHVGSAEGCEGVVRAFLEQAGRIDVLVNNAGTNPQFGPLLDADEGAINRIWEVNVLGPVRMTRYAVSAWMRDNGGSVINMASVAGIKPEALTGAYNASKAALISVTRTLSRELGTSRIRVNAIAPGLVETRLAKVLVETPQIHDHIVGQTALGRHADPSEIAGAALFLASDASSFVTGSVLTVDGGWTV
ncbi:MAG: SDR family oxidoreductase [Candidatus Dormibacteraeota bacterium]|nr:SDR family oxidoreductase [Candidatus Dormibacteraeota bacterium]MBV9525100.1 SDR family oxidoreductase [Candidatus Dormibacteraeota bacterium]